MKKEIADDNRMTKFNLWGGVFFNTAADPDWNDLLF